MKENFHMINSRANKKNVYISMKLELANLFKHISNERERERN